MLGMLRTAMPSICVLLRYKGLPQHWRKKKTKQQQNNNKLLNVCDNCRKKFIFFKEAVGRNVKDLNLYGETVPQPFARGRDGLRGGKLKIPKLVFHSEKGGGGG